MSRILFSLGISLALASATVGFAEDRPLAKAAVDRTGLASALGQSGACGNLGPIFSRYVVTEGLDLGVVVEAAYKACGDLDAVVLAALRAVTSVSAVTQAAEFAGGDPVEEVPQAVEMARLTLESEGITVLAYTQPPAQDLDRSAQVAPQQVSPVLWGTPVRDAGPDRTRSQVSPSRP